MDLQMLNIRRKQKELEDNDVKQARNKDNTSK